jgi:hypothetical protein
MGFQPQTNFKEMVMNEIEGGQPAVLNKHTPGQVLQALLFTLGAASMILLYYTCYTYGAKGGILENKAIPDTIKVALVIGIACHVEVALYGISRLKYDLIALGFGSVLFFSLFLFR